MNQPFGLLLYLGVLFGVPLVVCACLILHLRRDSERLSKDGIVFYDIRVGSARLTVTKRSLYWLLAWAFPILWMVSLLPLLFLPVMLLAFVPRLLNKREPRMLPLRVETKEILANLTKIQGEVSRAKQQIELLTTELANKQMEFEQVADYTATLEEEIDAKLNEYDGWTKLSDEEKSRFIKASRDALQTRGMLQTVIAVFVTIFLNLVAALIWALMGAPGRQDLLEVFTMLKQIVL